MATEIGQTRQQTTHPTYSTDSLQLTTTFSRISCKRQFSKSKQKFKTPSKNLLVPDHQALMDARIDLFQVGNNATISMVFIMINKFYCKLRYPNLEVVKIA